jgi:hypothetical protein
MQAKTKGSARIIQKSAGWACCVKPRTLAESFATEPLDTKLSMLPV